MIDVIYDKKGKIIFNGDKRKCEKCNIKKDNYSSFRQYELPKIKNNSERIFSEDSAYQMTSFLMGVIKRGTAKILINLITKLLEKQEQQMKIKMHGLLGTIPKLLLEFL